MRAQGHVLLLLMSVVFLAAKVKAGAPLGAAILKLPLSVRQMGMGSVTLGGEDVLRAWSNPALLASPFSVR